MTDRRYRLDHLMDVFLDGRSSFTEFQAAYSACYADEEVDAHFSSAEIDRYGGVHEKAEWTSVSPKAEDRTYGWIDVPEFQRWLSVHERYRRG